MEFNLTVQTQFSNHFDLTESDNTIVTVHVLLPCPLVGPAKWLTGLWDPIHEDETSTLPTCAVHFLIPRCHVFCQPSRSIHSGRGTENRARYGRWMLTMLDMRPNQRSPLNLVSCDGIYLKPIPDTGLLACTFLTRPLHLIPGVLCKNRWLETWATNTLSTRAPCLATIQLSTWVCAYHNTNIYYNS